MFELIKKRQLGDYIVDSFSFFKIFGKHFFRIFFVINSAMLLISGIIMFLFLKFNFTFLAHNNLEKANPDQVLQYVEKYPVLIGLGVVFAIVLVLISLFNAAYPVLYLKLIAEKNNNDFTAKDVLSVFRQSLWKIFKFTIGLIFIVVPVLLVLIIILFLLCFVLVGVPLLIIAIPTLFTFINISFYIYLTEEKSFFESLNHAYLLLKEDFWSTIGASFIVMIMMQMVQASITMLFYFAGIFAFIFFAIANPDFENSSFEVPAIITILISIVFVLILALSNIFNNILVINQGIIYYSLGAKNKISAVEIDLIGNDNE